MHIVFFEFALRFGGARRSTIETAKRLSKYAKVSVVDAYGCSDEFKEAAIDAGLNYHIVNAGKARIVGGAGEGIIKRIWKIGKSLPELLILQNKAYEIFEKINADIICSNCGKGISIISTRNKKRWPTVGYLRGWYTTNRKFPYLRYVLKKKVNHIIAVSQATRAALICGEIPLNKITVINNVIKQKKNSHLKKSSTIGKLPQQDRKLKILIAADYLETKGQLTAIKSLPHLLARDIDPVLYLAGAVGWTGSQDYVEKMMSTAKLLNVESNVKIIGYQKDIQKLMREVDIVALPSFSEGMPRVILEAMTVEVPVIATPVGGILDLILDRVTGLLFDVNDDVGMAKCIYHIAQYPDEAKAMTKRAKEMIEKNFDPEQQTVKLLKQFKTIIANYKETV